MPQAGARAAAHDPHHHPQALFLVAEEHPESADESDGPSRPRPFSLIRHVGRKFGRTYETSVILVQVPGGFIAELTYGENVNWYRNIVAAGGCVVVHHRSEYSVTHIEPCMDRNSPPVAAAFHECRSRWRRSRAARRLLVVQRGRLWRLTRRAGSWLRAIALGAGVG
jgi:deazaflavin-dependent oxidoreductase (nitroreductase family)